MGSSMLPGLSLEFANLYNLESLLCISVLDSFKKVVVVKEIAINKLDFHQIISK